MMADMAHTFDEIMEEAAKKGLWISNLFQLNCYPANPVIPKRPTGEWQANFVHANGWYEFGRGKTHIEALEDALNRANGKCGPENRPIPREQPVQKETAVELDDLI